MRYEASQKSDSGRCAWQAGGDQCRYPGVYSGGTLGQGPWYCREHGRSLSPFEAAQVVAVSQLYEPNAEQSAEKLDWLEANLPRDSGESTEDYNLRCRTFAVQRLKSFGFRKVLS